MWHLHLTNFTSHYSQNLVTVNTTVHLVQYSQLMKRQYHNNSKDANKSSETVAWKSIQTIRHSLTNKLTHNLQQTLNATFDYKPMFMYHCLHTYEIIHLLLVRGMKKDIHSMCLTVLHHSYDSPTTPSSHTRTTSASTKPHVSVTVKHLCHVHRIFAIWVDSQNLIHTNLLNLPFIITMYVKVKASHTRYQALGPDQIPSV